MTCSATRRSMRGVWSSCVLRFRVVATSIALLPMGPAMGSLLYCKPEFITKQLGNDERMIQCVDTINI